MVALVVFKLSIVPVVEKRELTVPTVVEEVLRLVWPLTVNPVADAFPKVV